MKHRTVEQKKKPNNPTKACLSKRGKVRDAILEAFHKAALNILSSTLVNQIRNIFRQRTQTYPAMLLTSGKYALGNVCVCVYTENHAGKAVF